MKTSIFLILLVSLPVLAKEVEGPTVSVCTRIRNESYNLSREAQALSEEISHFHRGGCETDETFEDAQNPDHLSILLRRMDSLNRRLAELRREERDACKGEGPEP